MLIWMMTISLWMNAERMITEVGELSSIEIASSNYAAITKSSPLDWTRTRPVRITSSSLYMYIKSRIFNRSSCKKISCTCSPILVILQNHTYTSGCFATIPNNKLSKHKGPPYCTHCREMEMIIWNNNSSSSRRRKRMNWDNRGSMSFQE